MVTLSLSLSSQQGTNKCCHVLKEREIYGDTSLSTTTAAGMTTTTTTISLIHRKYTKQFRNNVTFHKCSQNYEIQVIIINVICLVKIRQYMNVTYHKHIH